MSIICYQKNPFRPISKSSIDADGHPFELDGVTCIYLTMRPKILNLICAFFGTKSEEKFKKCVMNLIIFQNIMYKTTGQFQLYFIERQELTKPPMLK